MGKSSNIGGRKPGLYTYDAIIRSFRDMLGATNHLEIWMPSKKRGVIQMFGDNHRSYGCFLGCLVCVYGWSTEDIRYVVECQLDIF